MIIMEKDNEIILSVKDLKTYISMSITDVIELLMEFRSMFTKAKLWESWERADVVKVLLPLQSCSFFPNFRE